MKCPKCGAIEEVYNSPYVSSVLRCQKCDATWTEWQQQRIEELEKLESVWEKQNILLCKQVANLQKDIEILLKRAMDTEQELAALKNDYQDDTTSASEMIEQIAKEKKNLQSDLDRAVEERDKLKITLLNFIGSLTLCDHMGDVSNDIEDALEILKIKIEWNEFRELRKELHKMGATTLTGVELWDKEDAEFDDK